MIITLNGETVEVGNGCSVKELLDKFSLEPKKIAVEKNLEIVSRSQFSNVIIHEGDRIEIIHFIGGG